MEASRRSSWSHCASSSDRSASQAFAARSQSAPLGAPGRPASQLSVASSGATSPVGVTNLSRGRTYSCVVSAVNSIGPSTWSAPSDRIVVPAGPVTDVRATLPTATGRRTTVTFTPPAGGPSPVRYWVECRTTDGSSTLTAGTTRSPVTVADLVRGRTYTCRVWAIFGGGAAGPVSTPSNSIGVP